MTPERARYSATPTLGEGHLRPTRFLWVVYFDYSTRNHNGAVLRYLNYARELRSQGHVLYFATQFLRGQEEQGKAWFSKLKEEGLCADFFELRYNYSHNQSRLATLLFFPKLRDWVLSRPQEFVTQFVEGLVAKLGIDAVIVSSGLFFFLITRLSSSHPRIIDLVDCETLYWRRAIRNLWHSRTYLKILRTLRFFAEAFIRERYYCRRSTQNLVVSPVDKRALDGITKQPERSFVLFNGVRMPDARDQTKIPKRLIFSGNMNFEPNVDGAIWFIDHVLPLLLQRDPTVTLVIAGANPVPELLSRANANVLVTGHVADMNVEIAKSAIYVAPLVSGGGFKNKVVEALANRTFVVATSIAAEFLEPAIRRLIFIADTPEQMAEAVLTCLTSPSALETKLDELHRIMRDEFSWSKRTKELERYVGMALKITKRSHAQAAF